METVIEKELKDYIALVKKDRSIDERISNVMIAGLEAILSCIKIEKDIEEAVEELHRYLDKDTKTLEDYLEVTKKLDELNAPVTAGEAGDVIAGIESFKASKEFISEAGESQFDFIPLFKIFSKFISDAAHLSSASKEEIDGYYPGVSEDMDFTTPEGKKISRKYKLLAKFLKILAHILIIKAYIANAIDRVSEVLNHKLKNRYRSEVQSLRELEKSISKAISNILKSIEEIRGKSAEVLRNEYDQLVNSRKDLADLHSKLQQQVKFDLVSEALNNKPEVFAPIFDSKNRERLLEAAIAVPQYKQDSFTGLTGILNTRPDLSPLRSVMNEMFSSINDAVIMVLFATCITIAREASIARAESFVGTTENSRMPGDSSLATVVYS
jgi:hypothetical protein